MLSVNESSAAAAAVRSADTPVINRVTPTYSPPPPLLHPSFTPAATCRAPNLDSVTSGCVIVFQPQSVSAFSLSGPRPQVTPGGSAEAMDSSSDDGTSHVFTSACDFLRERRQFGKFFFFIVLIKKKATDFYFCSVHRAELS